MAGLLYREDIDEVKKRLTLWWNGGDIGRPAMLLRAPRSKPLETIKPTPKPEGWVTDCSAGNFDYRVYLSEIACANTHYLAESLPAVAPNLGPDCLALFLGCRGVDAPDTVWFEPCIRNPEETVFAYDPKNFYWDFTLRLCREQLRLGKGKFLVEFPDLIEGLDTLAAMRGTQELLTDLTDRPEWVFHSLRQITALYFRYYDILYDLIRDETGGSVMWAWAPGRMAKFQCDFSAMISPDMFREFMVPVLTEMCERVSYCMYHWDGPGALGHHDLLLSIPKLKMLQWNPGTGNDPPASKKWWPLYHKTVEAGKKIYIGCDTKEDLKTLKKEFGQKFKDFLIDFFPKKPEQAKEILEIVQL